MYLNFNNFNQTEKNMIEVKNLTKIYQDNTKALDNVSFTIGQGEICGYIGSNGAGKSTTVKILGGMLDFNFGEVIINGKGVKESPIYIKEIIGYVPETPYLFNSITPVEFFKFIGKIRKIDSNILKKRVNYFSELFNFKDYLKIPFGKISKGNKQKILISSALLHNPDIILLDEPLSGLDATSIIVFQDMLTKLSSKGKIIFYCSHLLNMIEKISTRIIILEKGQIQLNKKTDDLKKDKEYTNLENLYKSLKEESDTKSFDYEQVYN